MHYGIEAVEVHDGLAAREILMHEAPALALIAADLPEISGIDLLALMRAGDLGESDIPVVVRSEHRDEAAEACAREWGAQAIVGSAETCHDVAATIAELLRL